MQSMSPTYQCLNENYIDLAGCYQSHNNPSYQQTTHLNQNQRLKHVINNIK